MQMKFEDTRNGASGTWWREEKQKTCFDSAAFFESSLHVSMLFESIANRQCNGSLTIDAWNGKGKSRTVLITEEIVENPSDDSSAPQQTKIDFLFPPSPYSTRSIFWLPAKMFVNFSPLAQCGNMFTFVVAVVCRAMNESLLIVFVKL
jgi:hypothetical protein